MRVFLIGIFALLGGLVWIKPSIATPPMIAKPESAPLARPVSPKVTTPSATPPASPLASPPASPAKPTLEDSMQRCRKLNQAGLRNELLRVCKESFLGARINFARILRDHWVRYQVKALIDQQVDLAASQLSQEYRYWSRLKSSFSKETAKQMAENMARRAFLGEPFRKRIESLSQDISKDLNKLIQDRVQHSIHQSIECINSFLQSQYHDSMRDIFQAHVKELLGNTRPEINLPDGRRSVLAQHGKGIAGVGMVLTGGALRILMKRIGDRIAARMAQSLGLKIASRIGTKLIPWVGWGLLVLDVWDVVWAKGALPEIQKALKSPKLEAQIQQEIIAAMQESFEANYQSLARQIADSIYAMWEKFKEHFQKILDLAERDKDVQRVLSYVRGRAQLHILVQLYDALGEERIREAAREGGLVQLLDNPQIESLLALLRFQPDIRRAILWHQIAGRRLKDVVALEIHKHKNPEKMTIQLLSILLQLKEPRLVSKMLLLSNEDILHFDRISEENRRKMIQKLDVTDLKTLSGYLAHLDVEQRNTLVAALLIPHVKDTKKLENPAILKMMKESKQKGKLLEFFLAAHSYSDIKVLRYLPYQALVLKYGTQIYLVFIVGILLFMVLLYPLLRLLWFLLLGPIRPLLFFFRRRKKSEAS